MLMLSLGFMITPYLIHIYMDRLIGAAKGFEIVSTSINQQFKTHLFTSLTFASVPIFVMIVGLLIKKIKGKQISNWDYFFHFSVVFTACLLGFMCKFYAIKNTIELAAQDRMTDMVQVLPIEKIRFYDWSFYAMLLISFLMVLFAKRRRSV